MEGQKMVTIVGAGLSGLSAAITLARKGIGSFLISSQPSERAQSVLAEGGINAALNTMGEDDSPKEHFADTLRGGCYLQSEEEVRTLTEAAPGIVEELVRLGVPFNAKDGKVTLRNFGGQKKKRTAYAKSSTGKMIMTGLIDEARKYEAAGLIKRFPNHELEGITVEEGKLRSITVRDSHTGKALCFSGSCIFCVGGLNGFFEGMTTGTTQNTGNAAALAFAAGAEFSGLEMIQFHPTTVQIGDKRMLISEAARGEGGRLYSRRNGKPWYYMEEKYPQLGNLMPRDVVSRESTLVQQEPGCEGGIFLDLTGLSGAVWKEKLSDLRAEIMDYLNLDPAKEPVPVAPGIHYFMGGLRVDRDHQTSIRGLYAAGECACRYHGANRLGGNSMLGAICGGKVAAQAAEPGSASVKETEAALPEGSSSAVRAKLRDILFAGLGILRTPEGMQKTADEVRKLAEEQKPGTVDHARAMLGLAMVECALERKESRGAHYRTDYPASDENWRKTSVAALKDGAVTVRFVPAEQTGGGKGR